MLYPWAVPGRKVVCVNAGSRERELRQMHPTVNWGHSSTRLTAGETYTIKSVAPHPNSGEICIKLVGVSDRSRNDHGYWAGRFRPLRTQEESVALFAHHLTQAPVSRTVETHNMEPLSNDA